MSPDNLKEVYNKYARSVAYIAVMKPDGTETIGSAFNIGDGVFITARHVLEGNKIIEFAIPPDFTYEEIKGEKIRPDGTIRTKITYNEGKGTVVKGPFFHPNENVDVAVIVVEGINSIHIPISDHLDDWLGTEFILEEVAILGYPPIPFSIQPTLVVAKAEVNAIIDKYNTSHHPYFIVSAMARGGFSGGPAITRNGYVLGIITESLYKNDNPPELGYLSVLSICCLHELLYHHQVAPFQFVKQLRDFDEYVNAEEPIEPPNPNQLVINFPPSRPTKYTWPFLPALAASSDRQL